MAKQNKLPQYIYKINSTLLEANNWNLILPLSRARKIPGLVVSLADSQILSWINELNGTEDYDERAKEVKKKLKDIKKQPSSRENKIKISSLYEQLYGLQFKSDYVTVVMDKKSHYDRANKGFYINGVLYKRLICTTNGVKTSSVVYISDRLHDELKKRIENGKNNEVKIVPAKLGAYEALAASASLPVSWPKDEHAKIPGGVIVVKDCFTKFKTDLINIDTSDKTKEPVVTHVSDAEMVNNCSDGCSVMLPSLSRRWNGELNKDYNHTMSGCNLRCAWTKGMTFTFDFIKFAEEVAGASDCNPEKYLITDVWGDKRDVRDAELIVTEGQLKLWACYSSWEDYYYKCLENKYTIRVAKTAPHENDDIRQLNYQFIQSLELNDDDVAELIAPTTNEIQDIIGLDPVKSVIYLCGKGLDDNTVKYADPCAKALMVDKNTINDPYIRGKIRKMINKRIRDAKIGVLDVRGNFQILSGDLYALCENMFGMEPTGLLKAGEIYSKYWSDNNVDRVLCFRAPMSNAHSIVAQNISYNEKAAEWFKYIDTCVVVNAWDSMPAALNGFDFDGDLLFTTDNAPLMRRQTNLPALNCIQYNSSKKVVSEEDVIVANKQGFGSKIGQITNRITCITSLMANYKPGSVEYEMLRYRTQCGQALQQEEIDKAKGIIPTPMPLHWYVDKENVINDDDNDEIRAKKQLNHELCASKKPYFFAYNYQSLKSEYDELMAGINSKLINMYQKTFKEMQNSQNLTENEQKMLDLCKKKINLDLSPSTMNKICWAVEDKFDGVDLFKDVDFDYSVYKSGVRYDDIIYVQIKNLCKDHLKKIRQINKSRAVENQDETDYSADKQQLFSMLTEECEKICPDEKVLCDILLDLCYRDGVNTSIVWTVCPDVIIDNLLNKHNSILSYPFKSEDGNILCCGNTFVQKTIKIGVDEDDQI